MRVLCVVLLVGLRVSSSGLMAQRPVDFIRVEGRPAWTADSTPRQDFGVGVVFVRDSPLPGRGQRTDTVVFYRDTSQRREIAGYFLWQQTAGTWAYAIAAPLALTSNILEYGYEVAGLPIAGRPTGRWVEAVLGFTSAGRSYIGWAELDSARIGVLLWSEHLREQSLFFLPGRHPEFFRAPGGRPVRLPVGRDYAMHPLSQRGRWMQVRVAVPSDVCAESTATSAVVWIRYLDGRGRPQVWYHTRGC